LIPSPPELPLLPAPAPAPAEPGIGGRSLPTAKEASCGLGLEAAIMLSPLDVTSGAEDALFPVAVVAEGEDNDGEGRDEGARVGDAASMKEVDPLMLAESELLGLMLLIPGLAAPVAISQQAAKQSSTSTFEDKSQAYIESPRLLFLVALDPRLFCTRSEIRARRVLTRR
jgi:hypothetical protein